MKRKRTLPEWKAAAKARAKAFVEEYMASPEAQGKDLLRVALEAGQAYRVRDRRSEHALCDLAKACRWLVDGLPTDSPEGQALAEATRAFVDAAERSSRARNETAIEIGEEFSRMLEADFRQRKGRGEATV